MTKIKKLDKKDQPKSTKRKGKVIAKPKSDRHTKFHCKHPSCESRRHIATRWDNHLRNNPDHDNATDKE